MQSRRLPGRLVSFLIASLLPLAAVCQSAQHLAQSPQSPQTTMTMQSAPGSTAPAMPPVILHSDKPVTAEQQAAARALAEQMRKLKPANPMRPGFEIETPAGAKITLADLHGKVVLLDYWATWCAPCIEGLPELSAVYNKYRSNPKVAIYAVNPLMGDDRQKAEAFLASRHLTVPLTFDTHFMMDNMQKRGAPPKVAVSLPVVLLLDPEGKQQWFSTGGEVGDTTHAFSRELIARIDAQLAK